MLLPKLKTQTWPIIFQKNENIFEIKWEDAKNLYIFYNKTGK